MRLKFIMLATLSRCCSHRQLFCSSASLRNVSIFVWLLQYKDGAVFCAAGEHRELLLLHGPRGIRDPAASWLWGGGRHLSFRAHEVILLQNQKTSGSAVVAPSYCWNGHLPTHQHEMCRERCWQIFSDVLFHNKGVCAYSVKVFCAALPLKPWILFLGFPLEYCKICIWHWVPTAHTSSSQHEPSWEFVISGYSCTLLKPSSTYFGASPAC